MPADWTESDQSQLFESIDDLVPNDPLVHSTRTGDLLPGITSRPQESRKQEPRRALIDETDA